MSLDARERSVYGGEPWECLWFSCGVANYCYTNGDKIRILLGKTYTPEAISHTEIEQTEELRSGSLTVTLPIENELAQLFIDYLPPQQVSLVIYRGHEGEAEQTVGFNGIVSSVKRGAECVLTLVPEQDALKRKVPALRYQKQCPRRLFSPGCGVNKTAHAVIAQVTDVTGKTITSPEFGAHSDGYFNGGQVDINETSMAILNHAGNVLTLFYPIKGLVAWDTVIVYPGCDGEEAICAAKFNNRLNHLGFVRIPSVNPFGEGGIK